MDEEKMMEHVRSKCFEVIQLKDIYEHDRDRLIKEVNTLSTSEFWMNAIGQHSEQMYVYCSKYEQAYRDLCQLCHILGGKYLDAFHELLEAEEGE